MLAHPRLFVAAVALVFVALTALFALPLSTAPGTEALDLGPDTRLFLWTLGWDVQALAHAPLSIFDANIFFPERNTLAYSEHQIGSALVAAPVLLATGEPLLAMNFVLLASCALSGFGAFLLGRELGLGIWGALVAGLVFAFTPPRFFRLGQLHLATVQWIPFCLLYLHRYTRKGSTRHVVAACLFFTLAAWSGGQSGLFLALTAASLLLYLLLFGELEPSSRLSKDIVVATVLVSILNIPFLLPYISVQEELGLERSLAEAAFWSPNAESFLASPAHAHRAVWQLLGWQSRIAREAKAFLFPGFLPILLAMAALMARKERPGATTRSKLSPLLSPLLDVAIIAVVLFAILIEAAGGLRIGSVSASSGWRALVIAAVLLGARVAIYRRTPFAQGYRRWFRSFAEARLGVHAAFYLGLTSLTLWASIGPQGGLYAALYRWLPGFDFIRVPSRLTILTVLALAILAGFGAERLAATRRPLLVPLFAALILVELAAFPLDTQLYAVTSTPMDSWLKEQSDRDPIVVLPIPDPADDVEAARHHSRYMLDSLVHLRPLVNGYSGFTPPSHRRLFRILGSFPDEVGLAELEKLGVRYAVFHRSGYDDRGWEEVLERAASHADRMELKASFERGRVYEINY